MLAVLLVAAFGGWMGLLLGPNENDAVYEGKPVSYWLAHYQPDVNETSAPDEPRIEAVLREAGTNALPALLRMLRARDSSLALKLAALAQKQHLITIHFVPATRRNDQAVAAFELLGSSASNAVPALIKNLDEKRSFESEDCAASALGSIGSPAAAAGPALLQAATNSDVSLRYISFRALGRIQAEPGLVVPALIRGMNDPAPVVRYMAVESLGHYGPAAELAVPALLAAKGDSRIDSGGRRGNSLEENRLKSGGNLGAAKMKAVAQGCR